jgi:hypothetical protein
LDENALREFGWDRELGRGWVERDWAALERYSVLEGLYRLGLDGIDLADGDGRDVEVFAARG